jgi:hypothetical protein
MNFAELQAAVKQGVLRNDLSYDGFVNAALREIQNRRSFSFMRTRATVTLLAGQTSVALPADYKELQNVRPAITLAIQDPAVPGGAVAKPVNVVTEAEQVRWAWNFDLTMFPLMSVFITEESDFTTYGTQVKSLGIIIPGTQDLVFNVRYYRFLPDLVLDTDTNQFTIQYPEMVELKAKTKAFNRINDPAAGQTEQLFGEQFMVAVREDAYKDTTGRENRM